jgi:hypothetical protein
MKYDACQRTTYQLIRLMLPEPAEPHDYLGDFILVSCLLREHQAIVNCKDEGEQQYQSKGHQRRP